MRTAPLALSALLFTLALSAHAQPVHRAQRDDGGQLTRLGGDGLDFALAGALDDAGALYLVGGTGSRWVRQTRCPPQDQPCARAFLLKLSPDGAPRWGRAISPSGRGSGASQIVMDAPRDRVLVAGTYRDPKGPARQINLFVAAYSLDGTLRWRRDFDAEDSRATALALRGLAVGPDGAVHLTGESDGQLAGAKHTGPAGAHNGWDVFVLKLDPKGQTAFARLYGVPDPRPAVQANDYSKGLAIGPDGRIYVSGITAGDLLRGTRRRAPRSFLLTLGADGGDPQIRHRATGDLTAGALAIDGTGRLYQLGQAAAGHTRVGRALGRGDLVLEALDARGGRRWSVRFGSPRRDQGAGLALGPDGHLYVGGLAGLSGAPDGLLYSFDVEGRLRWRRALATQAHDEAQGVAVSKAGVALIGWSAGDLRGLPGVSSARRHEPADGFALRYPLAGPEGAAVIADGE